MTATPDLAPHSPNAPITQPPIAPGDVLTPIAGAPAVTTPKPGWQTSEFWLTLIAFAASAAYASGIVVANGTLDHAIALLGMFLAPLGYTVSRGALKAAHVKAAGTVATLLALLLFLPTGCSCGSTEQELKTVTDGVIDCAKTELATATSGASILEIGLDVEGSLVTAIASGGGASAVEAAIEALVVKYAGHGGEQIVACAVHKIEVAMGGGPPATGSDGSGASTAERPRLNPLILNVEAVHGWRFAR